MPPNPVPHVVIFPFVYQTHIQPKLILAELLSIAGIPVTFLNTDYNHDYLLNFTESQTRFACYPNFRFQTINDGLRPDLCRSQAFFPEMVDAMKTTIQPALREVLVSGLLETPVTCIIGDVLCSSCTISVAKELGIPCISFSTVNACYFWTLLCIPKLVKAGKISLLCVGEAGVDEIISMPGMEGFIQRSDLKELLEDNFNSSGIQFLFNEIHNSTRSSALVFNSFEDLEEPFLAQIRSYCSKTLPLGPIHALLNSRSAKASLSHKSFQPVDRSCMNWLDSQPAKSVVYVSFGSLTFMSEKQVWELWHGLMNSGKQFLWVIRKDSVVNKEEKYDIVRDIQERSKERGHLVGWSPQEEVLAHSAVGGFLTHAGWNSILESVLVGVPMICWPQWGDHVTISRYLTKVLKLGLDMKRGECDRLTIERMVRDLMEDKREDLMSLVDKMAKMAKGSISQGGSSYENMDALIQDIKLTSL